MTEAPGWFRWAGPAVFVLAFLVRLLGISWGLPTEERHWSLHPDEPVVMAAANRIEPWAGKFDPGFYNYGTFPLTVFRIAGSLWPGGGDGWAGRRSDLVAGRLMSALAGAGCGLLAFLIVRGRTAWLGALMGGLAVGLAPGLVVHSSFVTVDVLGAFFGTLALWLALEAGWPSMARSDPERVRWLLFAGVAAGLTAATKYSGIVVLAALVFTGLRLPSGRQIVGTGSAVLASIVSFVLATPGIVLNPTAFRRDFFFEMEHVATGHGLVFAGTSPAWAYQLGNLAIAFGPFLVILGVGGFVLGACRRVGWIWPVIAVSVLTYLAIGRAEVKFLRYCLPLVPLLGVGLGYLVGEAHKVGRTAAKFGVVFAILGLGGLPSGGIAASFIALRAMADADPRDAAGKYLKTKPTETSVLLASDPWFWSPTLGSEFAAPRWVERSDVLDQAYLETGLLVRAAQNQWDVAALDSAPDYVVFSSFENEGESRLLRQGVKDERNAAYADFLARLEAEYERDRVFPAGGYVPQGLSSVHDMMYVRPIVWVWKRKTDLPGR